MARRPSPKRASRGSRPSAPRVAIGLPDEAREQSVELLQPLVADETVLLTKTRAFHWNVTGPHFQALHQLFEEQYVEFGQVLDDLAERIRALGSLVEAGLGPYLDATRLEDAANSLDWSGMVRALQQDHEAMARQLRDDIARCEKADDVGTADLLTGIMKAHEKNGWMLRAHLEGA